MSFLSYFLLSIYLIILFYSFTSSTSFWDMLFFSEETFIVILFAAYLFVIHTHRDIGTKKELALNFSLEIGSLSFPFERGSFYNCFETVEKKWMDFVRDAPVYKKVTHGPMGCYKVDWAYLLWFFAGDGSISMYRSVGKKGVIRHYWQLHFTQSRVNVSLLEHLADFLETQLSKRYDVRPTGSWDHDNQSDYQEGAALALNSFRLNITDSADMRVIALRLRNCPSERKAKLAELFLRWYEGDSKDASWLSQYQEIKTNCSITNGALLKQSNDLECTQAWDIKAREAIVSRKISTKGILGLLESDMNFRAFSQANGKHISLEVSCSSALYDGEMPFILKHLFKKGEVNVSCAKGKKPILRWRTGQQSWIEEVFVRRIMLANGGPLGFRNMVRYCVALDLRYRGGPTEDYSREVVAECEETLLKLRTSIFGDPSLKINPAAAGVPEKARLQVPCDYANPRYMRYSEKTKGGKWVTDKTLTHVRWLITVIGDPTSADWLEPLKNPWQDKKLMKCYKKRFKHDL